MNIEWPSACAQAWDTPNTLKFIANKQKKFYQMIDRFYQPETVNKTGCRCIGRGKFVATVHRWVSDYENTQTTCGSPIDAYLAEGSRRNLRQQDCERRRTVLTGELMGAFALLAKPFFSVTLCQFKTENRVIDSSRHCYTAENRHGSIRESLFPVCPMLDGV